MDKKYVYNTKTHKLHIKGYCQHSKILPCDVKFFNTYDEALAYDGRAVGLCKICAKNESKEKGVQR